MRTKDSGFESSRDEYFREKMANDQYFREEYERLAGARRHLETRSEPEAEKLPGEIEILITGINPIEEGRKRALLKSVWWTLSMDAENRTLAELWRFGHFAKVFEIMTEMKYIPAPPE